MAGELSQSLSFSMGTHPRPRTHQHQERGSNCAEQPRASSEAKVIRECSGGAGLTWGVRGWAGRVRLWLGASTDFIRPWGLPGTPKWLGACGPEERARIRCTWHGDDNIVRKDDRGQTCPHPTPPHRRGFKSRLRSLAG